MRHKNSRKTVAKKRRAGGTCPSFRYGQKFDNGRSILFSLSHLPHFQPYVTLNLTMSKNIFIYKGDATWKHTSRNLLNSW